MSEHVMLTEQDIADVREIQRLLDEMYDNYLRKSDDKHHKSSEGHISLELNNYFDRCDGQAMKVRGVSIFSYLFGKPGEREHTFSSVSKALEEVREWHRVEMENDYDW